MRLVCACHCQHRPGTSCFLSLTESTLQIFAKLGVNCVCQISQRDCTLAAFCNLSPDSPTQMLSTSLATRISRMGLFTLLSLCTADQA